MASWRRLSFFDESSQTDPSGLLERASAVCALADGGIIVGEADGTCHSLNGALAVRVTFAAHSGGVTHLLQPRSSALVVSLGLEHEAGVPRAYLRAWRIGADEATCVRHLRVFPVVAKATTGAAAASTSSEPAITCCCAAADLSQIALGLADGSVQLLRCDKFLSDKFLSFKPLASIAAALPGAPAAVTNVAFCYAQGANHPPTDLWVVTSDALLSVSAAGLRSETSLVLAEGGGAAPECACVSDMRGQLVLGRPEAIYLYGADERGATYGFDMPKRCVLAFGGYLVVISSRELFGRSAAAESGGGGALGPLDTALGAGSAPDVGGPDVAATAKQHVVQLYDLANKYMGTSIELGARVKWAIPCSDRLLLLTHEGRLVSLVERPWKTKLQLLYRKHLYSTALALATARGMRRAVLSEIHREYADHLYAKGDLSSALDQYIETIGTLPPSTVIARYLTSQRVRDLTRYLQALVAEGSAAVSAPEHSALLLRCLAKLKDLPALEHFVQWAKREPAKAARHAPAAIETLRACGYASLAAELAEASGAPSVLLRLLVEETQEFDKVLALIRQMPLAEGRAALLRWGRPLLTHRPDATIELLVVLCQGLPSKVPALQRPKPAAAKQAGEPLSAVGAPPPSKNPFDAAAPAAPLASAPAAAPAAAPTSMLAREEKGEEGEEGATLEEYLSLFTAHRRSLVAFLEALLDAMLAAGLPPPALVANTLLGLYLTSTEPVDPPALPPVFPPGSSMAPATALPGSSMAPATALPGSSMAPATALPGSSMAPATALPGSSMAPATALASALAPLGIEARRQRASALIKRPGVLLDDDHALLLTFQYGWLDGRAQLYESLGRPHELLRHYILVAEDEKVLRTCRRHGESEPQMWLAALRHLVSVAPGKDERTWRSHLAEVLGAMESERLLSPLELVQALSTPPTAPVPLQLASELLERHLRAADAALEEQSREASRFGDDVAKMRAEIAEIDGCVRVFQQPKCSACLGPLDVPTIHFHCQHSYHLACLGDHDHECPLCAPQHRRVAEHQQQQRALARGQEDFYRALDNSADGVATVAEFLGRGFLSTINAK